MDYLCRPVLNQGTENIDKNLPTECHQTQRTSQVIHPNLWSPRNSGSARLVRWKPFHTHTACTPSGCPAGATPPVSSLCGPDSHPASGRPGLHRHQWSPLLDLLAHCSVWRHIWRRLLYFLSFFITIEMNRTESNEHQLFPCRSRQETVQSVFPSSFGPQSPIEELHDGQAQSRPRSFLQSACFQERPIANYFKRRVLFSHLFFTNECSSWCVSTAPWVWWTKLTCADFMSSKLCVVTRSALVHYF